MFAVLYVAARIKWIGQETLQTLSNVAGVIALLAAILVFVVPAAQIQFNDGSLYSNNATIPSATPTKVFVKTTPIATFTSKSDNMVLVYVPEGEFIMGSDSGIKDERPAHQVYLNAFWIDQVEVTNRMYALCVASGMCFPPSKSNSITRENYFNNFAYDDYPVMFVSWVQAKTYCEWAGRRLPTEAEWEKAARGSDGRIYPWGSDSPQENLLNYGRLIGDTTNVFLYPFGASPYGAYNMAGNVYEWVMDAYNSEYYANRVYDNPQGPALTTSTSSFHVVRGGSWVNTENYLRSSARISLYGTNADDPGAGFRCAVSKK
jgi:serine/threonine-protein kinase